MPIPTFLSANKRTLIIAAALALPVVIFAVLKPSAPATTQDVAGKSSPAFSGRLPSLEGNATAAHPKISLEEMHARVANRIAELEKMTPQQWDAERKTHPNRPATTEEAIAKQKKRLQHLESITPEQWDAEQAQKESSQP